MKTRVSTLLLTLLLVSACQGPALTFPGGRLDGIDTATDSFEFAQGFRLMQLEVNPEAPYSVNLRVVVIDGELYLDAAPARKWGQLLAADPRVRVRLDEKIYRATAIPVTNPEITQQFLSGRTIYRLTPGWQSETTTSEDVGSQRFKSARVIVSPQQISKRA